MGTYRTFRHLVVEAVQSVEAKTITTDLGFINVRPGEWVIAEKQESATSLTTHFSVAPLNWLRTRELRNSAVRGADLPRSDRYTSQPLHQCMLPVREPGFAEGS